MDTVQTKINEAATTESLAGFTTATSTALGEITTAVTSAASGQALGELAAAVEDKFRVVKDAVGKVATADGFSQLEGVRSKLSTTVSELPGKLREGGDPDTLKQQLVMAGAQLKAKEEKHTDTVRFLNDLHHANTKHTKALRDIEIKNLESAAGDLKARVDKLEKECREAQKLANSRQQELERLQRTIEANTAQMAEDASSRETMVGNYCEAKVALAAIKAEFEKELRKVRQQQGDEIAKLHEELESAGHTRVQLESDKSDFTRQIAELRESSCEIPVRLTPSSRVSSSRVPETPTTFTSALMGPPELTPSARRRGSALENLKDKVLRPYWSPYTSPYGSRALYVFEEDEGNEGSASSSAAMPSPLGPAAGLASTRGLFGSAASQPTRSSSGVFSAAAQSAPTSTTEPISFLAGGSTARPSFPATALASATGNSAAPSGLSAVSTASSGVAAAPVTVIPRSSAALSPGLAVAPSPVGSPNAMRNPWVYRHGDSKDWNCCGDGLGCGTRTHEY